MSGADPSRVSFPRGVWVALAVVALLQVGGILTQVVIVEDQRKTTRDQRAIAELQLHELQPLIYATREALPRASRTGRRIDRLTRELTPLTGDLRTARLPDAVRAAGTLAASLLDADLPGGTRALREMVREIDRTSFVPRASHAAALAPRQYEIQRQTLATQRQTLAIQRQTLAIQRQALELTRRLFTVAQSTERHAESIDRKTGGPAPAAAPLPKP